MMETLWIFTSFLAYITVGMECLKKPQKGVKLEKEVMATGSKNTLLLVLLLYVSWITEEALAAQHVVGGSEGWDESTDFNAWASGQTFKVGDQLGMFFLSN